MIDTFHAFDLDSPAWRVRTASPLVRMSRVYRGIQKADGVKYTTIKLRQIFAPLFVFKRDVDMVVVVVPILLGLTREPPLNRVNHIDRRGNRARLTENIDSIRPNGRTKPIQFYSRTLSPSFSKGQLKEDPSADGLHFGADARPP